MCVMQGEDDVEEVALVARKPAVREDVIHTNDVVLKRVTTWPPLHQPDLAIAKVKVKVARDTKPVSIRMRTLCSVNNLWIVLTVTDCTWCVCEAVCGGAQREESARVSGVR